jgi:hypothetical protein
LFYPTHYIRDIFGEECDACHIINATLPAGVSWFCTASCGYNCLSEAYLLRHNVFVGVGSELFTQPSETSRDQRSLGNIAAPWMWTASPHASHPLSARGTGNYSRARLLLDAPRDASGARCRHCRRRRKDGQTSLRGRWHSIPSTILTNDGSAPACLAC